MEDKIHELEEVVINSPRLSSTTWKMRFASFIGANWKWLLGGFVSLIVLILMFRPQRRK